MRRYRKLTLLFVVAMAVYIAANYLTWKMFTEDILTAKYPGGDMARLSYITEARHRRTTSYDLPRKHLELKDYHGQKIDVLTLGDSFSMGAAGGLNSYYQDYLATANDCTVLNIPMFRMDNPKVRGGHVLKDPLSTLIILLNSGVLDQIKPRHIVVESVERAAVIRFGHPIDFSMTADLRNVQDMAKYLDYKDAIPPTVFINNGNFNYWYYRVMSRFVPNPTGKVFVGKLRRPLFSVACGDKVLYYRDELLSIPESTPEKVQALNENFNRMADILAAKGIALHFMPAVDKYNIYSDYIVDNPYPKSVFFEELRKLPHRYRLIDTKVILREEVEKGEKDVFYADDTHWSWKASKRISEVVRFD